MAIAALVFWMCTVAAGAYLLMSRVGPAGAESEPEPATVPEVSRARDRFDPPSLVRAKNEPLPGMRALAEFTHPALAVTGLAFWILYVMSRDRLFAAIGFGVMLGAIAAGVSWVTASTRAARRGERTALVVPPRLLVLHGAGAALTLLIAALIVARA